MLRKIKGVNKFRLDPEKLRIMLEKQQAASTLWRSILYDNKDNFIGVEEIPGFLTTFITQSVAKAPL